jgi:hypothetical protein
MRFVTKLPNLSVVIEPGRQLTNPLTGDPSNLIPNKIIKFSPGFFVTEDPREIRGLLTVLERDRIKRRASTFAVYPEDEELAKQFQLGDTGDEVKPENLIATLQQQVADLQGQLSVTTSQLNKMKTKAKSTSKNASKTVSKPVS